MNLTSEQVHWLGGGAFVIVSLLGLARASGQIRQRWVLWLLPALFIGYGLESLADVWIHGDAVPANYATESRQHLIQGGVLLFAGIVEALLLTDRLNSWFWRLASPAALAVLASVFVVHDQHGTVDAAAMALMQAQHRGFAIALFTAAVTRALAALSTRRVPFLQSNVPSTLDEGPRPRHVFFDDAWLLPLFIFGVQMLVYRESVMTHG